MIGRLQGWLAGPGWRRLALAFVLGAGVASGQAPLGWWVLSLAALGGLVALVAEASGPRRAAWAGWLGGAGYFAGAMFWIVEPFLIDVPRHGWMAPFALILLAFGMALFWLAAAFAAAAIGRTPAARAVAFAVTLSLVELVRGYVLTGFPWALVGHIWADTPVSQASAWIGSVGLTLLTAASAAALVAWRGRGLVVVVGVLGGVWALGAARLGAPDPDGGAMPPRLRLVQPNAAQNLKWRPDMAQELFERHLELTARPASRRPDLVIWPEAAVPWLLNDPGPVLEMIAAAAGGGQVALGIQRAEGARYFNSLAVIDRTGTPVAVYDKFHLVPFGEYVPLGDALSVIGVSAFAQRQGYGYSPGPGAAVFDLGPLGKVQPLICYEVVFAQDLRAAPERPDWLMQVTNDAWFGRVAGPYQHLAQARLRAVEQGLPLIRVANTGISAVIDAKGRVLQSLPLGAIGIIDADLPAPLPATVYARSGDLPVTLLLLAALIGLTVRHRFVDLGD